MSATIDQLAGLINEIRQLTVANTAANNAYMAAAANVRNIVAQRDGLPQFQKSQRAILNSRIAQYEKERDKHYQFAQDTSQQIKVLQEQVWQLQSVVQADNKTKTLLAEKGLSVDALAIEAELKGQAQAEVITKNAETAAASSKSKTALYWVIGIVSLILIGLIIYFKFFKKS